jgi:hypothetical protein
MMEKSLHILRAVAEAELAELLYNVVSNADKGLILLPQAPLPWIFAGV